MPPKTLNGPRLYLRLLSHVRPYWRQFAGALSGIAVLAATEPLLPALAKPLLDESFVAKDPSGLVWLPIAITGLILLRGVADYAGAVGMSWVAGKVVLDLRESMFRRLLELPTTFFDQHPSGTIISKVTFDVTRLTNAATDVLTVIVRDSLAIMGLLGWMFYVNWQLSLVTFMVLPGIVAIIWVINKRLRHLARSTQRQYGDMTHILQEATEGQRIIKIFGGQSYETNRFHNSANWIRRFQVKSKAAGAMNAPLVQAVVAVGMSVIIYVASAQAVAGELSVGEFVSFVAAMGLLFAPIKRITSINERLQKGLAAAESVFALADEEPERDTGTQTCTAIRGRIEIRNARITYHESPRPALDGVDLTIEPGETIALVGPSGSGKTTLANLIPRFYALDSGEIRLDGINIVDLTLESLRSSMALVSQEVVLFNDTAAANIAYGRKGDVSPEQIEAAARSAHVLEFADGLKNGLETLIGEKGARLSGGQRQRMAIARALIKDAPILILDEATSSLDTESEKAVQEALDALRRGRTTIIIAHRLSTIENADRIVVLKDGRIAQSGTHRSLLEVGGLYAELYAKQFSSEQSISPQSV